jgi:hypothetical protein
MSVAETILDNAAQVSWDDQARIMLAIASDPAKTRERLDQLAAAMAAHDEKIALADRSADAADEKHRRADAALAEVADLQQRIEMANKGLREREFAVAANEQAQRESDAKAADRDAALAKREARLAAMVRATKQYLEDIEVT